MDIKLVAEWQFTVSGHEATLISKALSGNLKPGERKEAWLLSKQIAEMRAQKGAEHQTLLEGVLPHFDKEPEDGS